MGVPYQDAVLVDIREVVEGVDPLEYGLFCAVPSTVPDQVVLEPRDGAEHRVTQFERLETRLQGDSEAMLAAQDISGRISVTDARVALSCSRYDKGGNWTSAVGLAGKAMAARRRKGKMLVGHVRYPWLVGVYAQNRTGWTSSEMIRLIVDFTDKGKSRVNVNIYLPKHNDAVALASEIIRRAVRFRLAHSTDLDGEDGYRAELESYAEMRDLTYAKGQENLSGVTFKRHAFVESHEAALLGVGRDHKP